MSHYVQLGTNGSGEFVDTFQMSDGTDNVDRQAVVLADDTTYAARAKISNADPGATDYALATRPVRASCTKYSVASAASDNAAAIKGAPGVVYGYDIFNLADYPIYVKLYNKATAPAPATDNGLLIRRIGVQSGVGVSLYNDRGCGGFTSGIGIAIVKGIADTDDTAVAANDCLVNVDFI